MKLEPTENEYIISECSVILFVAVVMDCERWPQWLAARLGSIINV